MPRGRAEPLLPDRAPRSADRPAGQGGPGPRRDRPEGPRHDGPRHDGPRHDGPRHAGPRHDGPRHAGPPREGARPRVEGAASAAKPAAAPQASPSAPTKIEIAKPLAPLPLRIPIGPARVEAKAHKPALTPKQALAARTKAAQAAKPKHETKRADEGGASAEVALAAEWLAAGWDEARGAVEQAGSAAIALVDAWATASNVAAIAAIANADDYEGPARKEARRALQVLRARGVEVPARPQAPKLVEDKPEAPEASFVPADSNGVVSLRITRRDPSGRYQIAEVIFRDGAGILDAGGGWVSGSQLREARERLKGMLGVGAVPVPVEWARYRIERARQENGKSGRVLPLGLERCRDLLGPVPESEPAHPLTDLESEVTSDRAWALAPSSAGLHEEPEFSPWLPERGALEELLRKVGEHLGPESANDADAVSAALREEITNATDRFFSPELRAVVADRMRDAALSIRVRKGDRRAAEVLAVARAVREAGLITSPPREVGFLVAMFQKAVSYLLQQGGGSLRIPVSGPRPAPQPEEAG